MNAKLMYSDFINDYSPILIDNGFVRRRNAFYRRSNNETILRISMMPVLESFFVYCSAYPFAAGFDTADTRITHSSFFMDVNQLTALLLNKKLLDVSNYDKGDYSLFRETTYHNFASYIFPEFNKICGLTSYLSYLEWQITLISTACHQEEKLNPKVPAIVYWQKGDYDKVCEYLQEYLTVNESDYKELLSRPPGGFVTNYNLIKEIVSELVNGNHTIIDDILSNRMQISIATCQRLRL